MVSKIKEDTYKHLNEFKEDIHKQLNELKENSNKQLNEIRKIMHGGRRNSIKIYKY
jgi:hypothetical protein